MNQQQELERPITPGFRHLLLAVAILTYLLIVVGIILRATGLGSACPDWPACTGSFLPSIGSPAFLPVLHRLISLVTGTLLVVAAGMAWQRYRRLVWITRPLSIALALLALQVLLGGILVMRDEPPGLVALHLGLALLVQALVLTATVCAFRLPVVKGGNAGRNTLSEPGFFTEQGRLTFRSPFARLSVWTFGVTLALLVSGGLVSASGTASVCSGWPLCNGMLFPETAWGWINVTHRMITLLAGILVAALFIQAWRTQRSQTAILVSTTAAAVLFISQALMGPFEADRNYPAYLLGLHVATAAAVWAALVVQTTLVGLAGRSLSDEREDLKAAAGRTLPTLARDFLLLTKPVVVALLLVTTFAGMVVGGKEWPSLNLVFFTLLGGAMAAGGSGAINQYIDRFDDEKMQRTARRPIPSGRLTPGEGLAFGVGIALASFYLMVIYVNFLAALLTLAGIIYYVLLYSILLKKATVQNIVIGGGAGAIPPLVGWAAATGSLNIPSLFLFAVVFMWTPPHFWALALVRRNDYARAGVPMLPVVRGERETRWQIFVYTMELVGLTLVLPLFGLGGGIYFISAAVLGSALLFSAWKVWHVEGNKVAWKMYRHSSMYLAFLFLALMVDALL